ALCRASTSLDFGSKQDVDGRDIGVRKHAVLWTAMPGHDETCLPPSRPEMAARKRTKPQRNSLNAPGLTPWLVQSRYCAEADQRPLVQERDFLLFVGRHLHGFKRRRHRRFPGPDAPARLSQLARHHRDLADAVSQISRSRQRLR